MNEPYKVQTSSKFKLVQLTSVSAHKTSFRKEFYWEERLLCLSVEYLDFIVLYLRSSIVLPLLLSSSKKHYLLCATQFLDTGDTTVKKIEGFPPSWSSYSVGKETKCKC